jgi:hypothetical protein
LYHELQHFISFFSIFCPSINVVSLLTTINLRFSPDKKVVSVDTTFILHFTPRKYAITKQNYTILQFSSLYFTNFYWTTNFNCMLCDKLIVATKIRPQIKILVWKLQIDFLKFAFFLDTALLLGAIDICRFLKNLEIFFWIKNYTQRKRVFYLSSLSHSVSVSHFHLEKLQYRYVRWPHTINQW